MKLLNYYKTKKTNCLQSRKLHGFRLFLVVCLLSVFANTDAFSQCDDQFYYYLNVSKSGCVSHNQYTEGSIQDGQIRVTINYSNGTRGPYTITWTNINGGSGSKTTSFSTTGVEYVNAPSATSLGQQNISLTVTDQFGCAHTEKISVPRLDMKVGIKVNGVFTNEVSICSGQQVKLTGVELNHPEGGKGPNYPGVVYPDMSGGWSIHPWDPWDPYASSSNWEWTISPSTTKTFIFQTGAGGTSGISCKSRPDTIKVIVLPKPLSGITANGVSFPNELTICAGDPVVLQGSGGTSYTWAYNLANSSATLTLPVSDTTLSSITQYPTQWIRYRVIAWKNGCIGASTNVDVNVLQKPNVNLTANGSSGSVTICSGESVSLQASGGSSYTWSGGTSGSGSSKTVYPTSQTTYTVSSGSGNCMDSKSVTVYVNPKPVVNLTANGSSGSLSVCSGTTVSLQASGGTTYTWNGSGTFGNGATQTVYPTSNTTYTVSSGSGACANSKSVTVNIAQAPGSVSTTSNPLTICPGSSATISANASGATSYSWSSGLGNGATKTVSPTSATTYNVTASNTCGSSNGSVTVNVHTNPTVSASSSSPSVCSGASVTLSALGASSYSWNTGQSGASISVSPTSNTTYTVTGTDANGCTNTATVSVNIIPSPSVSASSNPPSLCSSSVATLSASGDAVAYAWSGGGITGTGTTLAVTPTTTTLYTVTGTGANGCTTTASITVAVNSIPTVSASSSSSSVCSGDNVTLSALGASSYSWNTGQSGSSISVSPTGNTTYTVTGTDVNGCVNTATVNVNVIPIPTVVPSSSSLTLCEGSSTTLSASGDAVAYVWSGGGITGTGTTLAVTPTTTTVYTVTGTGTNGCQATASVTVAVNNKPIVGASSSLSSVCAGSSVTLSAFGATSYSWDTGQSGSSVTVNPTANTIYTVTGTDANGCTNIATVNVDVIVAPTVLISVINPTICSGETVTLTASGATTYLWSNGVSGSSISVNPNVTTNYTVTGTSGSCTGTAIQTVTVNTTPTVIISTNNPTICSGQSITLTASGAATYLWSNGSTDASISVNPSVATDYTVTGTTNGCSATSMQAVSVSTTPTVTISISDATICSGGMTTLSASGATTYAWSNGAFGSSISVSPDVTTNYTVTGTSGGCDGTAIQTVTVNPTPSVSIAISDTILCIGSSVTLTASGANSYLWNNNVTSASITVSPTNTTTYSVIGTSSGCSSNSIVQTITVLPLPTIGISASTTTICSGETVTLTASGSGSSSYLWGHGSTSAVVTVTPTSTTTYTVVDPMSTFIDPIVSQCASFASITLNVIASPTLTISPSTSSVCSGQAVTLTASGAESYLWDNGSTASSITVSPTSTTTYSVSGESSGCSSPIVSETINVFTAPIISITASSESVCTGGLVTLTASGADAYVWNNGQAGAVITVGPSSTTTYIVTGTSGPCSETESHTISVTPSSLALGFTNVVDVSCVGEAIGSLTALAVGGVEPYVYAWSNGNFTPTINNLPAGVYQVVVTDNAGCSRTQSIEIHEIVPQAISIETEHEKVACIGSSVAFSVPQAHSSYTWNGPSNYTSNQQNIELTNIDLGQTGWYYVSAIDNNGCKMRDSVYLEVEFQQECFKLPELLTPNGDNVNDTWIIPGLDYFTTKELIVFNRWGNAVYQSMNYKNEWAGEANKGAFVGEERRLPNGTYFYILTLKNDEDSYQYKGYIELQY